MPNKLVDLSIKEVSGVDHPANMRKFLIIKRATPGNTLKEKLLNIVKQYLPMKSNEAMTFAQAFAYESLDGILSDMMYDAQWALRDTIKSIMADASVTDKLGAIQQALSDFSQVVLSGFQTALNSISNMAVVVGGAGGSSLSKSENQDKEGKGDMPKFSEDVLKKLPEEVRKELERVEELEKKAAEVDALKKKVEELQKAAQPGQGTEEDLLKGMPEAVRKMVEEARKEAKEAQEIAKAERETRLKQEFIAKAQQLPALGVKPEELGLVLKAVAEACPNEYPKVEAVLKAANKAIETSELFKSYGSGNEGEGSAWEEIQKRAAEICKSDPSITKEVAIAKVIRQEPELYNRYRQELIGS